MSREKEELCKDTAKTSFILPQYIIIEPSFDGQKRGVSFPFEIYRVRNNGNIALVQRLSVIL